MIKLRYNIEITNPSTEHLYPTNDVVNKSTLNVTVNSSGLSISGRYFKNGKWLNAASQMPIGSDYYVNNKEELVLQSNDEDILDVEKVFTVKDKKSFEIDPIILNHINLLEKDKDSYYKLNHVIQRREDIVLFKIESDSTFRLIDCNFSGPSHLVEINVGLQPAEVFAYFLVGKPLQVGSGNELHIPINDLVKLPEGFCTLKNKLATKNTTSITTTENGLIIQTYVPDVLTFSQPVAIDGSASYLRYRTTYKEYVVVNPYSTYETLDKIIPFANLNRLDNNLTMIYELKDDNTLAEHLCIITDSTESLISELDITYSEDDWTAFLTSNKEFKKKYVYKQYFTTVNIQSTQQEFLIENNEILLDLINNINKFSDKIIKL